MNEERSLSDWATQLAKNWEARASLSSRDLFVASHPDWQDEEAWERHAQTEIDLFLAGLDMKWLLDVDVLELGCGSGRLSRRLRACSRSYTGFDIAAGMVAAAEDRCSGAEGCRFFVGDGLSVPEPARDRQYGLVLAVAVFIHCPRPVIEANIADAFGLLQPGGQVRLSVLGVPDDTEGLMGSQEVVERATEAVASDMEKVIASLTPEERKLAFDTYYMGDRFRYGELEAFLAGITGGSVALYRGDPGAIYATITKSD